MKNYLKLLFLLPAMLILLASCKDKKEVDKPNTVSFASASVDFYGDPDYYDIYYYDLYLYTRGLGNDLDGSGTMAYLALNCKNTDKTKILPGTYDINTATVPQPYTFEGGKWEIDTETNTKKAIGSFIVSLPTAKRSNILSQRVV
ncbi:MAG: hypothetical protein ACK5L7_03765 [Paludibacteraceae bacterium]